MVNNLHTNARRSSKAFTLLETAIAILILAATSTALLFTAYSSLAALQNSKDINIAIDDIRAVAEGIRQSADTYIDMVQSDSFVIGHINSTEQAVIAVNTTQIPRPVNAAISWTGQTQRQGSIVFDMLFSQRG